MTTPIVHVDAFAAEMFAGNQAAVVVLTADDPRGDDDQWMRSLAAELNLAETAYVVPRSDGGFGLRWFTPTVEVELCGHATLASAHVLWTTGRLAPAETARFATRSGELTARLGPDGRIELGLPSLATTASECPAHERTALGITATRYEGHHPNGYRLLIVDSESTLASLEPDFAKLRNSPTSFTVSAPSADSRFDFVSRYFAPAHGVDEDHATGSAHCLLGPYWSHRLDQTVVLGHQISRRGAVIECEPSGDQVLLRGNAITVYRGELA